MLEYRIGRTSGKYLVFATVPLLLGATGAGGQSQSSTISGKVIDAGNNAPVSEALVKLRPAGAADVIESAVTETSGEFRIVTTNPAKRFS